MREQKLRWRKRYSPSLLDEQKFVYANSHFARLKKARRRAPKNISRPLSSFSNPLATSTGWRDSQGDASWDNMPKLFLARGHDSSQYAGTASNSVTNSLSAFTYCHIQSTSTSVCKYNYRVAEVQLSYRNDTLINLIIFFYWQVHYIFVFVIFWFLTW